MAKKTGTCMNLDCDNYKKEVEVEPGGEFECPLCHQPLKEGKGLKGRKIDPGTRKNKTMLIAGGIVVAAAAVVGIVWGTSGDEPTIPAPGTGETEIVNEPPAPIDSAAIVTPDDLKGEPETVEEEPKQKNPAPQPLNGRGTVDLGYGSYTGDLKNGKPHGYGTITYKKSHQIVPSKEFTANPGDTFEGEFRDGKISGLGYWKHNGDQTAVKP